jgi:quercetin dioxygenase-like cupin family protein
VVATKPKQLDCFPDVVTRLPRAEIAVEGAKAWILQSKACQLVFFEFKAGTKVPEHSHAYSQWGFVVDGKMSLLVDGEPWVCEKGTEYLIPAGAKHSATFSARTRVMDYFSEKNRYKPKAKTGST